MGTSGRGQLALVIAVLTLAPVAAHAQCYALNGACGLLLPEYCFRCAVMSSFSFDDLSTQRGLATDSAGATCGVMAPPCTDKLQCLVFAAQPAVNTAWGDGSASITLAQSPLAQSFGLTYYSERPYYLAPASALVRLGWTHAYAQTLPPADAVASRSDSIAPGDSPINLKDQTGLSPAQILSCKLECFAQLKTRPVNVLGVKLSLTHSFWFIQTSTCVRYILSAGPGLPKPRGRTSTALKEWVNQSVTSGLDNVSVRTTWDSGSSSEICEGVDAMLADALAWPTDRIKYKQTSGPNSNSAAHFLGLAGGFSPPAPSGSIGWDTLAPIYYAFDRN